MTRETVIRPTGEQFAAFERTYLHFNDRLFGGDLPPCILNLSRHRRAAGFFAPERWRSVLDDGSAPIHEISLNPKALLGREPREIAATLAHEMCHLWQHQFGSPSRGGYHNQQWAAKMAAIGLVPSDTGKPGGKRTGQRMSHYVLDDGPFATAYTELPTDWLLPFVCLEGVSKGRTRDPSKTKYSCRTCGANVWAKCGLHIGCLDCGKAMLPTELVPWHTF